ncbi:MAG TPA: hypothetical protein VH062_08180 [Polyangiaceae bacterium]|nr:hypothetical protein [Polyangiaceae bacterium]
MKARFGVAVLLALLPRPAFAALTDSEKAVVRTFIVKGVVDTAPRVRALVGRPDLAPEEISAALKPGLTEAPFDAQHEKFLDALLFGQGSAASRSTLVPAVVDGLLARTGAEFGEVPLDPGARVDARARKASEESVAISAYIDRKLANAGTPTADGHDPSAGILDESLEAAALLYKDYYATHAQAFGPGQRVSQEMLRVRLQMALTMIELGRGVVPRQELSEWAGFSGERRAVFERTGVVVEADGAPDGRVAAATHMLESAGAATDSLSAWLLAKVSPVGFAARGSVVRAGAALGETLHPVDGAALWPPEVKPGTPDAALVAVADSVAGLATTRALAQTPALRDRARTAAEHAARAGAAGYLAPTPPTMTLQGALGQPAPLPTPELVLAGTVQLVLLDGQRTIDLALIRAGEGRPEPLEQLVLALTVLASDGVHLAVGAPVAGGSVDTLAASDVKSVDGLVSTFTLGGKRYAFAADKAGVFTARLDGAIPKLTQLPDFRERASTGESFRANGVDYDRLFGEPRAAGLDDGRLVLEGSKAGFDAIATGPEGSDQEVAAVIRPTGAGGGLLVRSRPGDAGYEGVGVLLEVDAARVRLLRFDGHAKAAQLAEPIPLPPMPAHGYVVSLKVEGDTATAKVEGHVLTGKVVGDVEPGRVGLAVRAEAHLDVMHLVAKTKSDAAPAAPAARAPAAKKKK